MLPALLAQIGLPLLVKAVGGALKNTDNPVAKAAGEALGSVEAEIDQGTLSSDQVREANRHLERMAELTVRGDQTWLREVNRTIRAEAASGDAYVRRMRPTFGYIMAISWAAQMGAIAYVIVTDAAQAGPVIAAVSSLGAIWTVGLSVLGIYVYKRSQEKTAGLTGAGRSPTGLGGDEPGPLPPGTWQPSFWHRIFGASPQNRTQDPAQNAGLYSGPESAPAPPNRP